MFTPAAVIGTIGVYVAVLFLLARWGEHSKLGAKIAAHPLTFALGLSVYCTTWTFFGSVGRATTGGMLFLPVYLGPTLAMIFGWTIFRRMTELKHAHRLTSIADFISARYAKSQGVAALVTLIIAVGIVPYLALQIKSLTSTFQLLTGVENAWFAPLLVAMMVAFTIAFGIRHLDPTERHPGMVLAVGFESVVKLIAFLAAGVFVTVVAFPDSSTFFAKLDEVGAKLPTLGTSSTNDYITFITVTVLSGSAFAFLPRQFHQGIIENSSPKHVKTAKWATPLYLFLMNLFVVPIAVGGKLIATAGTSPDVYVLALPLQAGQAVLSMVVFIGGVSAALGMVIIETMTMATMVSNHVVLPLAVKVKPLAGLRPRMLMVRWVAAALLMVAAWQFATQLGGSQMLVAIGLISFAAAFLLAPVLLGGLFWRDASRTGAMTGLSVGFVTWFYTQMLPTFVKSKWLPDTILKEGPWGVAWLKPEALFGLEGLPPLVHGVLWSTLFGVSAYVVGSIVRPPSKEEALLTDAFLGDSGDQLAHLEGKTATISVEEMADKARKVFTEFMPVAEAERVLMQTIASVVGTSSKVTVMQYAQLLSELERTLAGAIGSASAHVAMKAVGTFERKDKKELEREFARVLAELKLNPRELKDRVDFEKEKSALLQEQFQKLEAKNGELEGRVQERTRELRAILDNVIFGFLVVGRDGRVQEGFTRSCIELLSTQTISGRKLSELFGLQGDSASFFEIGLDQIFEDLMPDELSCAQLPNRFPIAGRTVRAEARAVRNEKGEVAVLLFTLSDVSRLEAAEAENESNRAILSILKQRPSFEAFVDETRQQLVNAQQAIVRGDAITVRRMAHTIKGNAASYGIAPLVRVVHDVEEQERIDVTHLTEITNAFRAFLEHHRSVLGVNFDGSTERKWPVTEGELSQLQKLAPLAPPELRQELERWIGGVSRVSVGQLIGPLQTTVDNLSARLGKKVELVASGLETRVEPEHLRPFFQSLVHLVRNALDHGIEAQAERGSKPAQGKLELAFESTDAEYVVRVADDGRGIDTERVVKSALQKGVITEERARQMTFEEKVMLVFSENVSTAVEVTDLSGRGVGMSAVMAEARAVNATVGVSTSPGEGTSFEFRVPRRALRQLKAA